MKKLILFSCVITLVTGCGDENTINPPVGMPTERDIAFFGDNIAFLISIYGKKMEPDDASHGRFKALIGSLISDETLAKFVQTDVGFEGGGTYCIELYKYRFMPSRMRRVYNMLLKLNTGDDTRYDIKIVENCDDAKTVGS